MRLIRSWLQRTIQYIVINSQGHLTELIKAVLDFICKIVHKGIDYCEKDCVN